MDKNISNIEIIVWFMLSSTFVVGSIVLSNILEVVGTNSEWGELIKIMRVTSTDPTIAILQAINASTIFYAIYFYIFKIENKYRRFQVLVSISLFIIYISEYIYTNILLEYGHLESFFLNRGFENIENYVFLLLREYTITFFLFLLFFIADEYRANISENENEIALLQFNSKYLSFPSLITLLFGGVMLSMISNYQIMYLLPFFAGIASCLLFTTNMIMALATSKWYAKNLTFKIFTQSP